MKTPSSNKIYQVVSSMMDGTLDYFHGAELLLELRDEFGVYANDPDFVVFIAVVSELELLPEQCRAKTRKGKLTNKERKHLDASLQWAKEVSWPHCESLAQRYGL